LKRGLEPGDARCDISSDRDSLEISEDIQNRVNRSATVAQGIEEPHREVRPILLEEPMDPGCVIFVGNDNVGTGTYAVSGARHDRSTEGIDLSLGSPTVGQLGVLNLGELRCRSPEDGEVDPIETGLCAGGHDTRSVLAIRGQTDTEAFPTADPNQLG
jgi:hypothetical protein